MSNETTTSNAILPSTGNTPQEVLDAFEGHWIHHDTGCKAKIISLGLNEVTIGGLRNHNYPKKLFLEEFEFVPLSSKVEEKKENEIVSPPCSGNEPFDNSLLSELPSKEGISTVTGTRICPVYSPGTEFLALLGKTYVSVSKSDLIRYGTKENVIYISGTYWIHEKAFQ